MSRRHDSGTLVAVAIGAAIIGALLATGGLAATVGGVLWFALAWVLVAAIVAVLLYPPAMLAVVVGLGLAAALGRISWDWVLVGAALGAWPALLIWLGRGEDWEPGLAGRLRSWRYWRRHGL